jgi:hypothetical protein
VAYTEANFRKTYVISRARFYNPFCIEATAWICSKVDMKQDVIRLTQYKVIQPGSAPAAAWLITLKCL